MNYFVLKFTVFFIVGDSNMCMTSTKLNKFFKLFHIIIPLR